MSEVLGRGKQMKTGGPRPRGWVGLGLALCCLQKLGGRSLRSKSLGRRGKRGEEA